MTVFILLGKGDATFAPPVPVFSGIGKFEISVVVGDFNGDGWDDFAVIDNAEYPTEDDDNNVNVFLNTTMDPP